MHGIPKGIKNDNFAPKGHLSGKNVTQETTSVLLSYATNSV